MKMDLSVRTLIMVLLSSLLSVSCFEDNSRTMVLIKIHNLKKSSVKFNKTAASAKKTLLESLENETQIEVLNEKISPKKVLGSLLFDTSNRNLTDHVQKVYETIDSLNRTKGVEIHQVISEQNQNVAKTGDDETTAHRALETSQDRLEEQEIQHNANQTNETSLDETTSTNPLQIKEISNQNRTHEQSVNPNNKTETDLNLEETTEIFAQHQNSTSEKNRFQRNENNPEEIITKESTTFITSQESTTPIGREHSSKSIIQQQTTTLITDQQQSNTQANTDQQASTPSLTNQESTNPVNSSGEPPTRSRRDSYKQRRLNNTSTPGLVTTAGTRDPISSDGDGEQELTMLFVPRLNDEVTDHADHECSGLLIKKDFVVTAAWCILETMSDEDTEQDPDNETDIHGTSLSKYLHIRIQVVLLDGTTGFVVKSYLRGHLGLLQVEFDKATPERHHVFFPEKTIPLGASLPYKCRVEGFIHTSSANAKPQFRTTLLHRNSIFKHCPQPSDTTGVESTLLTDYANILCRYNLNLDVQAENEEPSLCEYLSGACLFCPELQGILYTTYARKVVNTNDTFSQLHGLHNGKDETLQVVQEILGELKLTSGSSDQNTTKIPTNLKSNESSLLNVTANVYLTQLTAVPVSQNESLTKMKERKIRVKKLTRSMSTLEPFCGTHSEVSLFVDTGYNQEWVKLTAHRNSLFKSCACVYHSSLGILIATLLMMVI